MPVLTGVYRIFPRWRRESSVSPPIPGRRFDDLTTSRLQLAAIPLLDPKRIHQDRLALQKHFKAKRDHVLGRLERLGLKVHVHPQATFYIWLNLEGLPHPLNNGLVNSSRVILKLFSNTTCRLSSRSYLRSRQLSYLEVRHTS